MTDTTYTHIRYDVADRIARITLNRPQYRNAQSTIMLNEMDDVFARAGADTDVGVIVLFGEGDHFSAGHDIGTPEETAFRETEYTIEEGVRGRFQHTREQFVDKTLRWRNVQKPTIAAVQGYCIFGGWIVASAMDIIFAAEDAMFRGSNFQYFSIPWDIHPRRAKEILFQGRFVDAGEACELGLVNRVVARDRLESEVMDYARQVAQNDPFQTRMIKMAINGVQDAQGFNQHITSAHAMFLLSSTAEKDPGYAVDVPEGRRRPMVQRALDMYRDMKARAGR